MANNLNLGLNILPTVTDKSLALGSSSKKWTIYGDLTGNASTATALTGGIATINGAAQTSSTSIYAPTSAGTSGYFLQSGGSGATPSWAALSASISIGAGTSSNAPTVNVTINGTSGTAQSITKATTGLYGVTKLSNSFSKTTDSVAATPKGVWTAMTDDAAKVTIGTQTAVAGGSYALDTLRADLGLSSAFTYKGTVTSLPTATDSTTYAMYTNGNVIIVSGGNDVGVYVYNKGATAASSSWDKLGTSVSYKITQSAVSSPTASSTAIAFIDTITQDTNGLIAATKKTVQTATSSTIGLVSVGTGLSVNAAGAVSVNYGAVANIQALGASASAGSSNTAARADHVHPYPTPSQIGAAKIAILADMGTIANSGSTSAEVTITKTVTGITTDMVPIHGIFGTPGAFLSTLNVVTGTNSVSITATIAPESSSTIKMVFINSNEVSGT